MNVTLNGTAKTKENTKSRTGLTNCLGFSRLTLFWHASTYTDVLKYTLYLALNFLCYVVSLLEDSFIEKQSRDEWNTVHHLYIKAYGRFEQKPDTKCGSCQDHSRNETTEDVTPKIDDDEPNKKHYGQVAS